MSMAWMNKVPMTVVTALYQVKRNFFLILIHYLWIHPTLHSTPSRVLLVALRL
jgi:hypothetical protein